MTDGQALVLAFDAVAFIAITLSYYYDLLTDQGEPP